MTKFIPKLKEISTKFSGFENESEPLADQESKLTEQAPPPAQNHQDEGASTKDVNSQRSREKASFPTIAKTPQTKPISQATTKQQNSLSQGQTENPLPPEAVWDIADYNEEPEIANSNGESQSLLASAELSSETTKKDPKSLVGKIFNPRNPLYRSRKFWLALGLGVGVSGSAIAVGVTWWSLESNLPDPNEVLTFVRDGTITIKADNGYILQQLGPATREKVKLEEMPPQLVQGFIASEDRRFYQHKGVDYQGIARAVGSNLVARNVVEGGSTITQQLARIVFLTQERSLHRKLQEMLLAGKIEQKMTKEQILERYLNLVYLGEGAYGVADAAWVYYSKPLKDLSLPEMATIIAVTPAPSVFSPIVNPKAAEERRNIVLQRMQEAGFITAEQAKEASAVPIALQPAPPKRLSTEAAYFTSYIQQELPKLISPDAVEAGGLTVETSLNPDWQNAAETAVEKAVKEYGPGQRFSQAALVSVDPRSGEVKAMVGGNDFEETKFNRVTQAQRQPGSTFKSFVYTTAIAAGFSPHRGYLDAPLTIDGYTPKNYDEDNRGWLSMRDALAKSVNIVALKVLLDVGFKPVINVASQMGIKSELKPTYSLALGASEVNLLELTSAYGTFATQGLHTEVHGIRRVLDQRGKVLYEANFQPKQAIDADTSAIMTWMLREVVNGGTGRAANLNDRLVAGKTGTSDQARDLWFIGYIPQLVTGVWLGNDDNTPTWGSSSTAARTWRNFMVEAVEGMPVEKFPQRPAKLEGRKATIAIEPIKGRRISSPKVASSDPKNNDNDTTVTRKRIRAQNDRNARPVTRRSRIQENSDNSQPVRRQRRSYQARVNNNNNNDDDRSSSTPRRSSSDRSRRRYTSDRNDRSAAPVQRYRRRPSTASNNEDRGQSQTRSQRRRSSPNYTSYTSNQPRRRSSQSSNSTAEQPRRSSKRYVSPSNNSAPVVRSSSRSRSSSRRSSSPSTPAVRRSVPSLAAPQPVAAPPTIELNNHR